MKVYTKEERDAAVQKCADKYAAKVIKLHDKIEKLTAKIVEIKAKSPARRGRPASKKIDIE